MSRLRRRLHELGSGDPGAPSDELAALLDHANHADAYLQVAYGEIKPTLAKALRVHLAGLDPLLDEPSLRILTQLVHRQERHVAELPAERPRVVLEDLGAPRPDTSRALEVMPRLDRPARDGFVDVDDDHEADEHDVHGLLHAALCAAELAARNSHEHPDMPWEFHADMARQCWDEIRHAEILDRLMTTELGSHWGDHPVGFKPFRSVYALDLAGRLERPNKDSSRLEHRHVREYLQADEAMHAETSARWRTRLLER